jgi:hypothetical protein
LWRVTSQPLEEAIGDLEEALKERTRERVPLDWAQTQNNLGFALFRLGEREARILQPSRALPEYLIKEMVNDRIAIRYRLLQNSDFCTKATQHADLAVHAKLHFVAKNCAF